MNRARHKGQARRLDVPLLFRPRYPSEGSAIHSEASDVAATTQDVYDNQTRCNSLTSHSHDVWSERKVTPVPSSRRPGAVSSPKAVPSGWNVQEPTQSSMVSTLQPLSRSDSASSRS